MKKNYLLIIGIVVSLVLVYLVNDNYQQRTRIASMQEDVSELNLSEDKKEVLQSETNVERDFAKERLEARNLDYRNNFTEYIKVTNSEYLSREIGGIFDLKIVFGNTTNEIIEEISAKVTYYKANGDIFDSEIVTCKNLNPQEIQRIPIEDRKRGTRFEIEIIAVNAPAFNFCYSLRNPNLNANNNDPYFCF